MSDGIEAIITSYNSIANRNKAEKNKDKHAFYQNKSEKKPDDILVQIETQLQLSNLPVSEKTCPECGRNFSIISVNTAELDCCLYCKSYWFDKSELAAITGSKTDVPSIDLKSRESKLSCPVCKKIMQEHIYFRPHNLLVDVCEKDGVYLESGELKRAFDIMNKNL